MPHRAKRWPHNQEQYPCDEEQWPHIAMPASEKPNKQEGS